MTGRDGQITSADPRDGTPVMVTARNRTWTWTPPAAVVVAGRTTGCGTDCGSYEAMCPNTVFHASRESAQAHLAGRGDLDADIPRPGHRHRGRPPQLQRAARRYSMTGRRHGP